MIIFPAIDIQDGKVVRLIQGKFDRVTEYSHDPISIAKQWESQGAEWLHVVDLDGAKTGQIKNKDIILQVARSVKIPVQMGGGIRTKEDVAFLIEGGIARVVLGTKVIEDTTFLLDILGNWNEKIAVSLDCSGGYVAQQGWTKTSNIKATDLAKELELLGLKCLIYTDIARDGMLSGPNYEGLKALLEATRIPVIASGGIADLDDIKRLKSLESRGVIGAITGKAIYEGKLDLKKALALC
ncbi:MAG: 1-(5-phosphoribosyl)-5-[(5-phosphoribosylamino)methylideneamino]imidazole-4-carboxamide isomerase [Candidatus Omnitrophota bacterium]